MTSYIPSNIVIKNHFPIVMQLLILGAILLTIFSNSILGLVTSSNPPIGNQPPELLPVSVSAPPAPHDDPSLEIDSVSLKAEAAYVWDVNNQRALFSRNAGEALPLASITKLMTSLLAYELVSDTQSAAISAAAIRQEGSSGLAPGEQLTLKELSEMALISSSNDAAYALSANVGALLGEQDANDQFVTGMNIRALELGLGSMQFYNPTGLDISATQAGAYGSARDVSFLMEHIVRNYPELVAPTKQTAARVYNAAGAYHDLKNTNPIITQIPNLLGSKTGYTDLAGGNLTIVYDAGLDRPIIITVLGSSYQERFTDVLTLLEAIEPLLSSS